MICKAALSTCSENVLSFENKVLQRFEPAELIVLAAEVSLGVATRLAGRHLDTAQGHLLETPE